METVTSEVDEKPPLARLTAKGRRLINIVYIKKDETCTGWLNLNGALLWFDIITFTVSHSSLLWALGNVAAATRKETNHYQGDELMYLIDGYNFRTKNAKHSSAAACIYNRKQHFMNLPPLWLFIALSLSHHIFPLIPALLFNRSVLFFYSFWLRLFITVSWLTPTQSFSRPLLSGKRGVSVFPFSYHFFVRPAQE